MTTFRRIAQIAVATLAIAAACASQAQQAKVVSDYTVFLDPPTGFVFVKLPAGWKFVGQVDATTVGTLPGNVVTALLEPEAPDAARLALDRAR